MAPLGFLELVSPSGSSSLSFLLPERVMLGSDPVGAPSESSRSVRTVPSPSGVATLSTVLAVWVSAFVAAASGSISRSSVLCEPSSQRNGVGVVGMGGVSLFEICVAPVRVGMSCAYMMGADVMGAGGLGGPLAA